MWRVDTPDTQYSWILPTVRTPSTLEYRVPSAFDTLGARSTQHMYSAPRVSSLVVQSSETGGTLGYHVLPGNAHPGNPLIFLAVDHLGALEYSVFSVVILRASWNTKYFGSQHPAYPGMLSVFGRPWVSAILGKHMSVRVSGTMLGIWLGGYPRCPEISGTFGNQCAAYPGVHSVFRGALPCVPKGTQYFERRYPGYRGVLRCTVNEGGKVEVFGYVEPCLHA